MKRIVSCWKKSYQELQYDPRSRYSSIRMRALWIDWLRGDNWTLHPVKKASLGETRKKMKRKRKSEREREMER